MACRALTWPSSHHPMGTEAQRTNANADTLDYSYCDYVFCQDEIN